MSLTASCTSICAATARSGARGPWPDPPGPPSASRAGLDGSHQPGKESQMDTRVLARPSAPRKLRVTLTAGQAATAARHEVRAAIRAWNLPVNLSVAVLLTSELVSNTLRHEAGTAIELVISCAYRQLQVDVYGTAPAVAPPAGAAESDQAAQGLVLLRRLSSSWGGGREHV